MVVKIACVTLFSSYFMQTLYDLAAEGALNKEEEDEADGEAERGKSDYLSAFLAQVKFLHAYIARHKRNIILFFAVSSRQKAHQEAGSPGLLPFHLEVGTPERVCFPSGQGRMFVNAQRKVAGKSKYYPSSFG